MGSVRSLLVTGASTGIGEATARHFDRLGWQVFAGVRRDEDGARLRAGQSDRLRPVLLDITDRGQVDAVMAEIEAATGAGGLAALVNNAGVAKGGPLEYLDLDEWRHQLEVNVVAQVAVTKAALPLIRRGGGRVVFIGSISGRVSTPFMGPYGASKHAIEAVAESLAHELHEWGIHVALVEPGAIRTAIWGKGRTEVDAVEASLPPEALDRYGSVIEEFRTAIDSAEEKGIPPERVAEVIEHALTARRPRLRYLVGTDAKVAAMLDRFLPDRVMQFFVRVAP